MLRHHAIQRAICAAAIAVTLHAGGASAATTLFDNGGATVPGSGGPDLTAFVAADDFVLAAGGLITGGTFDYAGMPADSLAELTFYIYTNDGTGLFDKPGTQLASGSVAVTDRTFLGYPGYVPHTRAAFTLETPFAAAANTHYWFGLGQYGETDGVSWAVRDFTPSETSIRHHNDDPGYWRRYDFELAFSLTGTAVPEPATWALMIGGFGAAGAMLRRRRTAALSV